VEVGLEELTVGRRFLGASVPILWRTDDGLSYAMSVGRSAAHNLQRLASSRLGSS
jgi:hypothetical protein